MEKIYALLNIMLPIEEGWNEPYQVFFLIPVTIIIFLLFMKWFLFGGLEDLIDRGIFSLLDRIPSPPPMTDKEYMNALSDSRKAMSEPDPSWAKWLSIGIGLFFVLIISMAAITTDWSAWWQGRKYYMYVVLTMIAFWVVASVGAAIDKKGKLVSIPVFLMIVGAVCFVIYQIIP
jgi:hypothetical protein